MKKRYLLGLDNGSTVTKAALYDVEGREIAVAGVQVKPIMEKAGFVERDMEELWQANAKAIRDVIQKAGADAADIRGLAVTGHGCGAYFVDEQGRPVGNGIVGTDTRAKSLVERWNKDGTYELLLPKTMQIIWAGQTLPIVAWHKAERREMLDRVRWVFSCKDYIRFRLTGEAYEELTDVSVTNGVNLNTISYDKTILEAFGIEDYRPIFPPIRKCTDVCGTVTREAARLTGLREGTPVAGGLFDVAACCIGSGVVTTDRMCMVAGTWSINVFLSEKPIASRDLFQNAAYCMDGSWMIMENSMTSAGNLEWFVNHFMELEKAEKQRGGQSEYQTADELVMGVTPDEAVILFLPYLYGTNVNADARACFFGISGLHTKSHMLRAIYEGVAFSHRAHMENLLRFRKAPGSIRISGGGARSRVWVQIFADVLQIPIEVSAAHELGTLGAAMCAGIGSGELNDFYEAASLFSKVAYTCMPDPALKSLYDDRYRRYRKLSGMMDSVWKE